MAVSLRTGTSALNVEPSFKARLLISCTQDTRENRCVLPSASYRLLISPATRDRGVLLIIYCLLLEMSQSSPLSRLIISIRQQAAAAVLRYLYCIEPNCYFVGIFLNFCTSFLMTVTQFFGPFLFPDTGFVSFDPTGNNTKIHTMVSSQSRLITIKKSQGLLCIYMEYLNLEPCSQPEMRPV